MGKPDPLDPFAATKQLMTSYINMHGGPSLLQAATKVMRARSDRGSRYTDKDRSEETKDRALISAIIFLSTMTIRNNSLMLYV